MALHAGRKRSRESPSQQQQYDPCAMVVDDDASTLVFADDDPGADADREDGDDDSAFEPYFTAGNEPPRRKRAMLIRANLQFLQKLPPLSNYQRDVTGRRGGVDGGTLNSALGMDALEASMGESSVSIASRPAHVAAAAVAPVAASRSEHVAFAAALQQQSLQAAHSLRRNTSIAFAAHSSHHPPHHFMGNRHGDYAANTGKDDEARPATSGSQCW